MQLWRPEFELDEKNSGICYHCIASEREIVQQMGAK